MNSHDLLKESMTIQAKQFAVLKLVSDRARFAIEYADSVEDATGVIRGMIAQFIAIQEDIKPCLD